MSIGRRREGLARWNASGAARQRFRNGRGKAGRSWYVDETYIKVQGHWRYLYRAIDRSGALVDVMFSGFCQHSRQQV